MGTDGEDVASWANSSLVICSSLTLSSLCSNPRSFASPSSGVVTGGLVGDGCIFCWRKVAKNLGSHCGGRKQNSTTVATSRDNPIAPIATVGLCWVKCTCGVNDVGDLSGPRDIILGGLGSLVGLASTDGDEMVIDMKVWSRSPTTYPRVPRQVSRYLGT